MHYPGSGIGGVNGGAAAAAAAGIQLVGVPQPKLMHGFSTKFQDMFTARGSKEN